MRKKLCFIGNSHLGCIKRAWTEIWRDHPGVKIDFFVNRSAGTIPLTIGRSADDPTEFTDILLERGAALVPADYDGVFVFSLEFSLIRLAAIYSLYRAEDQAIGKGQHLISDAVYLASAKAALRDTRAVKVAKAVSSHGGHETYIVEQPRPSAYLTHAPEETLTSFRAAVAAGDGGSIERMYLQAAREVANSAGAQLVEQPTDTAESQMLTKGEYGLCDINDQSEGSWFARGDFIHMNPAFGRLVVEQIMALDLGGAKRRDLKAMFLTPGT